MKIITDSREYLEVYLYQRALQGGYEAEFKVAQKFCRVLRPFKNLPDFIKGVRQDARLKSRVVRALARLWPRYYQARPALGTVLLLARWDDLPRGSTALEDFYYQLFTKLANSGGGI